MQTISRWIVCLGAVGLFGCQAGHEEQQVQNKQSAASATNTCGNNWCDGSLDFDNGCPQECCTAFDAPFYCGSAVDSKPLRSNCPAGATNCYVCSYCRGDLQCDVIASEPDSYPADCGCAAQKAAFSNKGGCDANRIDTRNFR